jgi:hypothetical protein
MKEKNKMARKDKEKKEESSVVEEEPTQEITESNTNSKTESFKDKITMGEYLSTSREYRKLPGYKYLEVGFTKFCQANKVEYRKSESEWKKLFEDFMEKKV